MKINIKATGITLTPDISNYVEKRIFTIEKYVESSANAVAQVEVGKNTLHHKSGDIFRAEVHIVGAGLNLYAASEQSDLYAAIDLVKDEIIQSILHTKGKRQTLTRKGAQMIKNAMKGISNSTTRGFSWGMERFRFKGFKKRP
ncbi:MAG: ribosome-associated translation inhibitor RaiA [Candidatus Zambryskibacteria bacterium]|nr:ribosome-associated translation inhibitor RaiA [Candidatus Zambryskibacteria bacterium]